jgi:predicted transcriptional regulator
VIKLKKKEEELILFLYENDEHEKTLSYISRYGNISYTTYYSAERLERVGLIKSYNFGNKKTLELTKKGIEYIKLLKKLREMEQIDNTTPNKTELKTTTKLEKPKEINKKIGNKTYNVKINLVKEKTIDELFKTADKIDETNEKKITEYELKETENGKKFYKPKKRWINV